MMKNIKNRLGKNALLVVVGASLLATSCTEIKSPAETRYKNLANEYSGVSLLSVVTTDYSPISTKHVKDIEDKELYNGLRSDLAIDWKSVYKQDHLPELINSLSQGGVAEGMTVTNSSAVNGDSFRAKNQSGDVVMVRMLGLDSPKKGMLHYSKSKDFLNECLKSAEEIQLIIPTKTSYKSDDFVLAHAYANGISCNQVQISNGMSMLYKPKFYDLFDFQVKTFLSLEDNAKENKLGLWGERVVHKPWASKHKDKGDY